MIQVKFKIFLDDEESSLVPVFVLLFSCLVVLSSPISTFSIGKSRKKGLKFDSHVQGMCKSCTSNGNFLTSWRLNSFQSCYVIM